MSERDTDRRLDDDTQLLTRKRFKKPPLYRVVFHNDDYTTREFVVMVLEDHFHKTRAEATSVMLHIHTRGKGIAGVYPYDIAATKIAQVEQLAQQNQMPLRLTMEPESGGEEE